MAKNYSIRAEPWMDRILGDLNESFGYSKIEAFRYGLRLLYKKEFPQYRKTITELKTDDPKGFCKSLGGILKKIDGKDACVIKEGSGERIKYL